MAVSERQALPKSSGEFGSAVSISSIRSPRGPVWSFLPQEPASVSTGVDHRYSPAALKPRDEFQQKRCCGFALRGYGVTAGLVTSKHAVSGDTSEIEEAVWVLAQCIDKGLTKRRAPVALEG